ncbi:MAG: hypothetical protein ACKOPR_05025 [Chakrabartia godavariana]
MKPELSELLAASQAQTHPDARFALLQGLNTQLAAADALQMDLVAIRISEAIDQLIDDLGLGGMDGTAH